MPPANPSASSGVDAGKYDIALQNSIATVGVLEQAGINVDEHSSAGFHAWNNWRDYLALFTPLLFRQNGSH